MLGIGRISLHLVFWPSVVRGNSVGVVFIVSVRCVVFSSTVGFCLCLSTFSNCTFPKKVYFQLPHQHQIFLTTEYFQRHDICSESAVTSQLTNYKYTYIAFVCVRHTILWMNSGRVCFIETISYIPLCVLCSWLYWLWLQYSYFFCCSLLSVFVKLFTFALSRTWSDPHLCHMRIY